MLDLGLLAGAMLAIAGGVLFFKANRSIALYRCAIAWPKVPGRVVRSDLRTFADSEGILYRVDIACDYSVGDKRYSTSRLTGGRARDVASTFPAGRQVEISVDPLNPESAVLITGKPNNIIVLRRVGAVTLVAGVAIALEAVLGSV